MRKVIVILILLILLAGTGFGFGYVPLRLEPGTQAVLFTKTSGWEEEPFRAGEFAWRWEFLVPTNATLYVFPDESRVLGVDSEALLPSGNLYSEYLEGTPELNEVFAANVRYRIAAEALPDLAPNGLRPEGLEDWYTEMDDRVAALTLRMADQVVAATLSADAGGLAAGEVAEQLQTRLQDRLTELEILSVVVNELRLPDMQLYIAGRSAYFQVQQAREDSLISAARELAGAQAASDQPINNLERYGQVLSEFPVLLEYLEIAAQNGSDPLDLTALQELAAPTGQ